MSKNKVNLLGKNGRAVVDGVPLDLAAFSDDRESVVRSMELINESMKAASQRERVQKTPEVAIVPSVEK